MLSSVCHISDMYSNGVSKTEVVVICGNNKHFESKNLNFCFRLPISFVFKIFVVVEQNQMHFASVAELLKVQIWEHCYL